MLSTTNTAVLILAGGRSSRMGQDKALLLWKGVPLLQRVITVAHQCGDPVYCLTPWVDRYQQALQDFQAFRLSQISKFSPDDPRSPQNLSSQNLSPPIHWLQETNSHQGPLVALHQGLAVISQPWVLVLACDLPLLDVEILQTWRSHLATLPASIFALVPHHEYWHPLCGFYRPQALPILTAFLSQGGKSFQHWLPQLPAQKIPLTTAELTMLWNCNSPQDFPDGLPNLS
ncbi:MAG: NTP transferase domain-containing protein [Coleofasciculaceae cyanobacterium SM2_1_6]|nr:NTP transferase domain-containing protein [Coleofasciculaceae cyanobacterium SM2_1_6]